MNKFPTQTNPKILLYILIQAHQKASAAQRFGFYYMHSVILLASAVLHAQE